MEKTIYIKLKKVGKNTNLFSISDDLGNVIATNISKKELISGKSFSVDNSVSFIILSSLGDCTYEKKVKLQNLYTNEYYSLNAIPSINSCLWRHLTNIQLYNSFYGKIHPYIIEYPFPFQYQDEILQSVKDYTKSYEYLSIPDGVFNNNVKIEKDDKWFTNAIVYNGQQSSGMLNLVAKPLNNLQSYNSYPIYNTDSKTITYTKSDNFFQYNMFFALQKSSQVPLFNKTCESLSIDKVINQDNMDYSYRSFSKAPIRAKDLKIRHILDQVSNIHLVSQFLITENQISYL